MRPLSPSKLCPYPTGTGSQEDEWFRLARTSDGLLCLESISDRSLNRPGAPADWAFGGDVPPAIARQLTDDGDHDQVAQILDRAIRALGYGPAPAAPPVDHDAVAVKQHIATHPGQPPAWTSPPCQHYAGGLRVDIPDELVQAVKKYAAIPDGSEHRLAALNAVAYIGERLAGIVTAQLTGDARNSLAEASEPPVQSRTVLHPVRHPMQPVVLEAGVARFRGNRIVRWLVDRNGLNAIVMRFNDADPPGGGPDDRRPCAPEGEYHDDYQQLMQLLGYSVEGYAELSRHNPDVYAVARFAADRIKP